MLKFNNAFNILRCERFKIKFIRNIKVRTYCLRVVINDNCLITLSLECPCAVNRAIIKFDTLSDSYRAGTEYKYFFSGLVSITSFSDL